ncbi:hypothetical protein DND58_27955 [Pseudomonas syringae pv. pisi]|uniref:Uncharacterized protein n=2 Tax=Pseudomonas syringae group TaxID=136849 RepID=F3GEY0_PSESJ|nr:hypothetical protein PSYPI_26334 [Pseudomonas syringae pv. pisi str. 1704B]PYD08706.1 hypothetical protein DND62_25740 [Pseudomonas syringae pv. pisi]RMU91251.1 hypothetical protein ALP21_200090 [Pseudomonas savastanoi pv. phaseolicola]PYD24418.1 hypothetical protein DND58_27955 [Pseudomonas syringae pv. pisi]PYD27179.1 hypothetical protein DND67_24675 [Pseudomonas syringae pv. pisi]
MILIKAHGIGFITTEQVDTRHDHMNMWFTLNRLACLFIIYPFNLRQMCFGVKIELFLFIRIHEKLFEFSCNCFQCRFRNNILAKAKRECQVAVLPTIRNAFIYRTG